MATVKEDTKLAQLMDHYSNGKQDTDTRMTRKNGWNDIINAYMGKLPANWPYNSLVTDPRIRTTVLEKTSRLLNAKLQGRLVPREGGDMIKAQINNALLDFQWDNATTGGSMLEKVAMADQTTRLFGACWAFPYWDTVRNTNELKIIDQRDIWFDGSATHLNNAKWVQVREFTTIDALEARGYDVSKLKSMIKKGEVTSNRQDSVYTSQVKMNRNLDNRVGQTDDPKNPVIEIVTEWTKKTCTIFLPQYGLTMKDGDNPYKHGKIPLAQLRYYPLGDDIYGEIEVECVLPLQRAINAILCGFVDEMNISMRPPLKISSVGVRIETIQYGPGAHWIMTNPNLVQEMEFSSKVIANFNATYPALLAAFNTAMGDQSLGVSNGAGSGFNEKTAREVTSLEKQQNNRDQYNQLYLSEFLKEIMMMWLSNNKQYLFDDPQKHSYILKVIGKEQVNYFKQMLLSETDIPDHAMREIAQTIQSNPEAVSDEALQGIIEDVSVPTSPVIMNPDEQNPSDYDVQPKLKVNDMGDSADLHITEDDFDGDYDYIPDVSSMASGAGNTMKDARKQALDFALNPEITKMLQLQGSSVKIKDLLVNALQDAGYRDAESMFTEDAQQPNAGGQAALGPGQQPNLPPGVEGMAGLPPPLPPQPIAGGVPQPQGI